MKKSIVKGCFFFFIFLFGLNTKTLSASPTLYGPTGLITVPTAEALRYKECNVAFDYMIGSKPSYDNWVYKMNLGTFQNWELGMVGGKVPTEGMFLNVKYYLMSDSARFPLSIALGCENLSSLSNSTFYMVASKKFRADIGAHLGFKAIFDAKQVKPIIMGGCNYVYNDKIEVMADVNSNGDIYMANVGAHYYVIPDLAVRAFVINLGDTEKIGGIRYTLGFAYSKFL